MGSRRELNFDRFQTGSLSRIPELEAPQAVPASAAQDVGERSGCIQSI